MSIFASVLTAALVVALVVMVDSNRSARSHA